ncbi:hypothetical protein DUNSADRAFT_5399 [Dunaliella salina]|uniref:Encoded protein n=1 Tax=Dunaliella salina TaxID=3046 RepID=A0ABQ7FUB6_DUNSA|nr:hypothetical protein DUNSADRAFT_5399 [Dunaliella salina]|eukprot:KAF5826009.1 hypothetical protein DUNSADRAFT_5399 [Dunaliella salina]
MSITCVASPFSPLSTARADPPHLPAPKAHLSCTLAAVQHILLLLLPEQIPACDLRHPPHPRLPSSKVH